MITYVVPRPIRMCKHSLAKKTYLLVHYAAVGIPCELHSHLHPSTALTPQGLVAAILEAHCAGTQHLETWRICDAITVEDPLQARISLPVLIFCDLAYSHSGHQYLEVMPRSSRAISPTALSSNSS